MASNENFNIENRFQIIFSSQRDGFKTLNRKIIDVTLPSLAIGLIDQPTPIKSIKIPGDSLDIGDLNITFAVDEDFTNYKTFANWVNRLRNFKEIDLERDVVDITVMIMNAKYKTVFEILCEDCFPYNMSDIFLNQQIQDLEPSRFLVSFAVNELTYK